MKMVLGLTEALSSLVETRFASAKASSSLIFSATELAIIRTSAGAQFQLRYCPALGNKPKANKTPSKKPDPFENPPSELLVAHVPATNPTHLLVLNKFPVIANHFILATKTNKQQTHALEQDDLEITYACLRAWETESAKEGAAQKKLFAFFNSGAHSGASQPHRHLQFLPVESMKSEAHAKDWDPLIDTLLEGQTIATGRQTSGFLDILQHPTIPFAHFAVRLPSDPTGEFLLNAYNTLLRYAGRAVNNESDAPLQPNEDGSLPISYNLAMTTSGMAILPRRSEGSMIKAEDGTGVGYVELNGTALGGTLMVKKQEEWDALRARPEQLDTILKDIGTPLAQSSQAAL